MTKALLSISSACVSQQERPLRFARVTFGSMELLDGSFRVVAIGVFALGRSVATGDARERSAAAVPNGAQSAADAFRAEGGPLLYQRLGGASCRNSCRRGSPSHLHLLCLEKAVSSIRKNSARLPEGSLRPKAPITPRPRRAGPSSAGIPGSSTTATSARIGAVGLSQAAHIQDLRARLGPLASM